MTEEIYYSNLAKINNTYLPQIQSQLVGNGIQMTEYQKQCVISAIQAINAVVAKTKHGWSQIDQNNMTHILLSVAALQLNAASVPREVYFQTRSVKQGDEWTTQIEMGIEGDGNDALLRRYGQGIKAVHPFWEVREEDSFTYPGYTGLEMSPPTWQPTGRGKVVRVVYPIELKDGTITFKIAEREDVIYNLRAHINNNLMNETFGFVKGTIKKYGKEQPRTRYDATEEELEKINAKKEELMNKFKAMDLDTLLDEPTAQKYISPAWKSPQSREAMLVRKMRNNAVKKYPRDFGNAYVALKYQEQDDEVVVNVRKDVSEETATEHYDFDAADETMQGDSVDGEFTEIAETGPVEEAEKEPEIVQMPDDDPAEPEPPKNRGF